MQQATTVGGLARYTPKSDFLDSLWKCVMAIFDVFNGDADGLCGLQQLYLAQPRDSVLVTGVKRDIELLARVPAQAGDVVHVLDISLAKNRTEVIRLLAAGARVEYFDHHETGEPLPDTQGLTLHIDTAPEICTSLLVDQHLDGRYRIWAVVGAFGDNLATAARQAAAGLALGEAQLTQLQDLGILLNYNAYGEAIEDLIFPPAQLHQTLRNYSDPLAFIADEPAYRQLRDGYAEDMEQAQGLTAQVAKAHAALYLLPDAAWARRAIGVYANALVEAFPDRAHAILTPRTTGGGYVVSVRAPLNRRTGADTLCRQFPTGGGRKAAAGINHLPDNALPTFTEALLRNFQVG